MSNSTTLAQARTAPQAAMVNVGFFDLPSFELMQRVAKMLSSSTLVPTAYRALKEIKEYGQVTGYEENPAALSNCVVALNMAQRMGADPLMIMQNLHIIEGRPSWSSAFIIASINSCGRYSSLRFEITEAGEPTVVEYTVTEWQAPEGGGKKRPVEVKKKIAVRHQSCKAWAIEKETGERLESPTVSIQMAIDEGWLTKKGSKWQTIPELMLRYRCASFFGRLYAPELLMGLHSTEEAQDVIDAIPTNDGTIRVDVDALRANATEPAAPAKPKHPDATDTELNQTPADIVDPEPVGQHKGGPLRGHDDPPLNQGVAPAYLDADKVLASIQRAKDHDILGVAADSIQDCDPERQEELQAAYHKRLDKLDGVTDDSENPFPEKAPEPASQPRRRRAAVDME